MRLLDANRDVIVVFLVCMHRMFEKLQIFSCFVSQFPQATMTVSWAILVAQFLLVMWSQSTVVPGRWSMRCCLENLLCWVCGHRRKPPSWQWMLAWSRLLRNLVSTYSTPKRIRCRSYRQMLSDVALTFTQEQSGLAQILIPFFQMPFVRRILHLPRASGAPNGQNLPTGEMCSCAQQHQRNVRQRYCEEEQVKKQKSLASLEGGLTAVDVLEESGLGIKPRGSTPTAQDC